jgi:hypothetical protein
MVLKTSNFLNVLFFDYSFRSIRALSVLHIDLSVTLMSANYKFRVRVYELGIQMYRILN